MDFKKNWVFLVTITVIVATILMLDFAAATMSDASSNILIHLSVAAATILTTSIFTIFLTSLSYDNSKNLKISWKTLTKYQGIFKDILLVTLILFIPNLLAPLSSIFNLISFIATIAFFFIYFTIIDNHKSPLELKDYFTQSFNLLKGHYTKFFLFLLSLTLLNILGSFILFIGLLITIPITVLAIGHFYHYIKNHPVK